jgi:hypothetical protein
LGCFPGDIDISRISFVSLWVFHPSRCLQINQVFNSEHHRGSGTCSGLGASSGTRFQKAQLGRRIGPRCRNSHSGYGTHCSNGGPHTWAQGRRVSISSAKWQRGRAKIQQQSVCVCVCVCSVFVCSCVRVCVCVGVSHTHVDSHSHEIDCHEHNHTSFRSTESQGVEIFNLALRADRR